MRTGCSSFCLTVLLLAAAAAPAQAQEDMQDRRLRNAIERAAERSFPQFPARDAGDAVQQARAERQRQSQDLQPGGQTGQMGQMGLTGTERSRSGNTEESRPFMSPEDRANLRRSIREARDIYRPPSRP